MGVQNTKKTPKFHAHLNNPEGVNDIQLCSFNSNFYLNNKENSKTATKIVTILIPLDQSYWEKQYNANEKLSQIEIDFKEENSIPKNIQIDWSYKNRLIKMDNSKIISLIKDNNIKVITIYIQMNNYKLNSTFLKTKSINGNGMLYGKPFFLPFEIVIFDKMHRVFKTQNYEESLISEKNLDKCNSTSAYCNGNNHLYISGGVDNEYNLINMFWEINLNNINDINCIQMNGKKNHSMICISKNVFIIGGGDENTYYYNCDNKTIINWVNLNFKRVEPALIKFKNFLYCFDSIKDQNNKYSFERIDITSKNPSWEIIYPKISENLNDVEAFSQKFYGVAKDFNEECIIFLGGCNENYDQITPGLNEIKNLKYNVNKNLIEKSNIPYKEFFLKEKTFIPFNNKADFILPDFDKLHQKIVFYLKEKNLIDIIHYKHKIIKKEDNNNLLSTRKTNLKGSLSAFKIDFSMPNVNTNIENSNNFQNNNFNYSPEQKNDNKIGDINLNVKTQESDNRINLDQNLSLRNSNNINIKNYAITDVKNQDIKIDFPKNNNVKKNEVNNTTITLSSCRKFHSSCHDPNNFFDENIIKNARKSVDIPSYFPKRRDIKKTSREFYWKSLIEAD